MKVAHGEKGHPSDKHNSHARFCAIHGWHGILYICPAYPRHIKNKLKKYAHNFKYRKIKFIVKAEDSK